MTDPLSADEVRRAVDLAVLQHQFKTLNDHVAALDRRIGGVDSKVDTVLQKLSEARGGWRTLMWLGGAAATVGSLITWLTTHTFTVGPR